MLTPLSRTTKTQIEERYEKELLQGWRGQAWDEEEEYFHGWRGPRWDEANRDERAKALSWMLQRSVRPSFDDLAKLWKLPAAADASSPDDWLHRWCLDTVVSADNPFIPGMTLSVLLSEGVQIASEGEQRTLITVRGRVEGLLLEVLERLPKTVRGFPRGMEGCAAMFEPEGPRKAPRYLPGPLAVALQKRRQTEVFCAAPLVMDFLSLGFKKGLPDLRDINGLRGSREGLTNLCGEGHESLVLFQSHMFHRNSEGYTFYAYGKGSFLQGTAKNYMKSTVLPGAQFIAAGVVAKPCSYYYVPAMRMALDFLVYVGMLAFFCTFVLLFEEGEAIDEDGEVLYEDVAVTWGEIVFVVYVAVSLIKQHTSDSLRIRGARG